MRQDDKGQERSGIHLIAYHAYTTVTVAVIQKCVSKMKNYEVASNERCSQSPLIKL